MAPGEDLFLPAVNPHQQVNGELSVAPPVLRKIFVCPLKAQSEIKRVSLLNYF